jgi:3-oxoacyl-[acyl-carrier protein] reductase
MSDQPARALTVDLSGQVAIVTGASQGLGQTMATELAANGAKVACVARNSDKLAETVKAIEDAGGEAVAFSCDVKDRESVDKLVDEVVQKWGKLDILVNNAGITRDNLMPRMADDEWDDVIGTNLRGAFLFARAASRIMMRARSGRIINISSVSALIGNQGQTNYSASKAGLIGMTRSLRGGGCRAIFSQPGRFLHDRRRAHRRRRDDRISRILGRGAPALTCLMRILYLVELGTRRICRGRVQTIYRRASH